MRSTRAWNRSVSSRRATAVMVAVVVGLGATGCGAGGAAGTDEQPAGELRVAVLSDASAAAEVAAAERFNETSDVKVVIEKVADNKLEYQTQVSSRMGSAKAPDLFMTWGAQDLRPLVAQGFVSPLEPMIAADPALRSSFLDSVFQKEVVDGVAYGVPVRGIEPSFLFYNKSVLADAGLQPAATWEDLLAQVEPLKARRHLPIALAGRDLWPTQLWFQYAFARRVGSAAVAAGLSGDQSVWAGDASRAALADLRTLVDSDAFGPTFDTEHSGSAGSGRLMVQGIAAYELMTSQNYSMLEAADPQFVADDLGWIAFPELASGSAEPGQVAGGVGNFYNVNAQTKQPEAAAAFLRELYSDEFVRNEIALGNLPATHSALDLIQADAQISDAKKAYAAFVYGLVSAAPAYQVPWDHELPSERTTAMQSAMEDYVNGALDADGWIAGMGRATVPAE